MSLFDHDKSAERLPVSLITGFLGSGKTTLLNRLLRHAGMADSAVIINEFGEIGLDHLLVEAVDGEVTVLASGCICCTVRSDLEETLRRLLVQRDAARCRLFARADRDDRSGRPGADRAAAAEQSAGVAFRAARCCGDDGGYAPRGHQLDRHPEAVKQVALADRLLLSKTDLGDSAPLLPVLRALNPAAPVTEVRHGVVEPDRLFGASLFDPQRKTPDVRGWIAEAVYSDRPAHSSGIAAFCLTFDTPLRWPAVSDWLSRLRQWRGQGLLRVKGILNLQEETAPVVIHGVHHIFHPPVRLDAWPDNDRRSRIVFISAGFGAGGCRGRVGGMCASGVMG